MAFQSPPKRQFVDPTILLSHFIRQIESQHIRTATQEPIMLHFDFKSGGLVEYGWPVDPVTAERVLPSQLEAHRRSHEFCGPSCLCAFLQGKKYTEAEVSIVEISDAAQEGGPKAILNGEYIAICAKRRCGFFLCLERFYPLPHIKEEAHRLRAKPLALDQLVHVSDIGKSYRRGDGLRQVMPDIVTRGRVNALQSASPEENKALKAKILADLMTGVSEDVFWDTFVQCLECKHVQLRQHYAVNHRCLGTSTSGASTQTPPRHHPYCSPPLLNRRRKAHLRARLSAVIGDTPAHSPLRGMQARASLRLLDEAETTECESKGTGYSTDYELTDVSDVYYDSPTDEDQLGEAFLSDDSIPSLGQVLSRTRKAAAPSRTEEREDGAGALEVVRGRLDQDAQSESLEEPMWTVASVAVLAADTPDQAGDHSSEFLHGSPSSGYSPVRALDSPASDNERASADGEETSSGAGSDDMGPPAERTSDMEKWPSPYDCMYDAIVKINGPQ